MIVQVKVDLTREELQRLHTVAILRGWRREDMSDKELKEAAKVGIEELLHEWLGNRPAEGGQNPQE